MQEKALGVLNESLNTIVFTLAATAVLSSFIEDISKLFFCMFTFVDKFFHGIHPMGKLYHKYVHLSSVVKFIGLYAPGDLSL